MSDFWPPPSDFRLMLQNPRVAFKDSDLKTCIITLDSNQQPAVVGGAFANVYHGTYQNVARKGDVAIKVFSSPSNERQERYKAVSDYLKLHPLKCLVDFEFLEKGILHGMSGKWYPIVRMEWVQGDMLFNWARARCGSRDTKGLDSACAKWVELTQELTKNQIAHGNLEHANVMVTDQGELKLVDYDGMCVPSLVGRRNLEMGVEPYQTPKRTDDTTLFEGIDNFSALYIYVVLKALTAAPALWTTFVEPSNAPRYDKLLFRATDFENPRESKLYEALRRSPDHEVGKLADELAEFWRLPLEDIPALGSVVNDYGKVRELLSQKAFDRALKLIDSGSGEPDEGVTDEEQTHLRWRAFAEELRSVRDEHTRDWGGLNDAAVARFVCGECSNEEARLIDATLQSHPVAREGVEILRSVLQASNTDVRPENIRLSDHRSEAPLSWDSQIRDLMTSAPAVPGIDTMAGIDFELLDAVVHASRQAEPDCGKACGRAIQDFDRLYVLAAGEDDHPVMTSPLWFTRMRSLPQQLWWSSPGSVDEWLVKVNLTSGPALLEVKTRQSSIVLPSAIHEQLPDEVAIRWQIAPVNATSPTVRGVFELLTSEESTQIGRELEALSTINGAFAAEMATVEVLFAHELFDEALLRLLHLDELFAAPIQRLLIRRSLAALYRRIFSRLNSPPLWMGDPEGLWAAKKSGEYLRSSWIAVGIDYTE